jgi:hypothetical protein
VDSQAGLLQNEVCFSMNNTQLFADSTMSSASLLEIELNTPLKIVERLVKTDKINGVEFPWYKVKVGKTVGYMNAYDIAVSRVKLTNSQGEPCYALVNIDAFSKLSNLFDLRVKLVKNKIEIGQMSFESFSTVDEAGIFNYDISAKVLNNRGLRGAKNVLAIRLDYGACGYTNGVHYIFWDGTKLFDGIDECRMSEAGISYEENVLIFPADRLGKQDTIVSNFKACELSCDDITNECKCADSTISTRIYVWKPGQGLEAVN